MVPIILAVVVIGTAGVLDGDTIVVQGEHVRLFGLDAPERYTPDGPPATRAMAQLTKGHTITCTEAGPRSYRRLVAKCIRDDGKDLACEMIRLRVATEYVRFSRGYYRTCGDE